LSIGGFGEARFDNPLAKGIGEPGRAGADAVGLAGRFEFTFTPKHGSWLNLIEGFFSKLARAAYPSHTAIKLILDNHSAHISRETKAWLAEQPCTPKARPTARTRGLPGNHQTVQRCVERALAYGAMGALDDRARAGHGADDHAEAKAWLVSLACRKAKDLGYPHELCTTRLLARHAREHGPAEGHASLGKLVQGTLCKILNEQEVKPHKVALLPGTPRPPPQPRIP
jgi:hypothetical protein